MDEKSLAGPLRTVLHEADPTVPARFETMEELFADALAHPRFRTQLIGAFGGMAALLAAVGIFSVLAYLVGQRTRELAVRRAVGAQAGDLVRHVVGHGLRLIASGLVVGLIGALAGARLLEGLLFEISPWDITTYAGAVVVLGITALLATVIPALRAVSIDPLVALRHE
jgi:ABC-type antimicrobial peptide transport system permease subunit